MIRPGYAAAELVEPRRVVFTQHLMPRPALLGRVDLKQTYELTPRRDDVHVMRTVEFTPEGAFDVIFPLMEKLFLRKNERIMDALKESRQRELVEAGLRRIQRT